MDHAALNTAPPAVRCGMCGSRTRADATGEPFRARTRWITCRRPGCAWSSQSPRRVGLIWRARIWLGR